MKILSYIPDKPKLEVQPPAGVPAAVSTISDQQVQAMSQQIEYLNREVESLRKSLTDMAISQIAATRVEEPPAPQPVVPKPVDAKPSREVLLERIGESAPAANPERKVAFFSKVWDYLNQAAIEVPPRKNS